MPSMTTYSPYETLTLFQSIAKYGSDASTFQDISTALIHNEFIPQNGEHDAERLSAKALRGLYDDLVSKERHGGPVKVNGDVHGEGRSPKRRKLSASPQPSYTVNEDEQLLVQEVLDKLYTRYKAQVIKEIRQEEDAYAKLQEEIDSLESKIEAVKSEAAQSSGATHSDTIGGPGETQVPRIVGSNSDEGKPANPVVNPSVVKSDTTTVGNAAELVAAGEVSVPAEVAQARQNAPASSSDDKQKTRVDTISAQGQGFHPAPALLPSSTEPNKSTPLRSPATQSHVPTKDTLTPSNRSDSPAVTISSASNGQNGPPTRYNIPQVQTAQVSHQPHAYPPHPQYPPQWHPHMPHPHYAQHAGYGPPPYYPQPVSGQHPQTPQQPHYQPHPHTAPMYYGPHHGWHGQPYAQYPASSATTPISRPASQVSVTRSGSTTPWRKRQDLGGTRPGSPKRPERAISPLEVDDSTPPSTVIKENKKGNRQPVNRVEEETPTQHSRTFRRGRPLSKTPSAMGPSRSQSNASHVSDAANDKRIPSRHGESIKAEPPSTPLPPPSDSETQRSSGRRGRPRKNTYTSQTEANRGVTAKRKRETVSPSPSLQSTSAATATGQGGTHQTRSLVHDSSLVMVSKNFSKTSQLLLNEITSHKLAGIFAKPLSERDAPGYKDLIQRTQDLKSIKAAISKGNRAALAAIEAIESEGDNPEPASMTTAPSTSTPGAIGNGFYLVTKTSDLIPPKGIVNGAQLEMELMRMFANAIMFNPLSSSERGFGRHLKLRRNGGDVDPNRNRVPDSQEDASEDDRSSEDTDSITAGGTGWDEGGIIADTREMFDDVSAAVDKWRGLEDERMGMSGPHIESSRTGSIATPNAAGTYLDVAAARHASVSASSNIGDDEGDGGSTPVPSSVAGMVRKRRRIAEH